jgi:hypothetical protein
MKDIRQIHRNAMELAKQASESLRNGKRDEFLKCSKQALEYEKEAALTLVNDLDAEPTRSVLFRSAAYMAFNIGDYIMAEQLIHFGLAGNPFIELKNELKNLLVETNAAIENNYSVQFGIENAYMELLREKAIYLKLQPKEDKYSKAIVINYIIDFLSNIQSAFANFAEVNFRKMFSNDNFLNFDKLVSLFKQDTKTLCVDLKFESFGVSISADSEIMNYNNFASDTFKEFKEELFENFKRDVLLPDHNSEQFQAQISKKYSPEERTQIYSPIIDSLKDKNKYKVSIVDKSFKKIIRTYPSINHKSELILKPKIEKHSISDDTMLLQRTFELTNTEGQKISKLFSEQLDYAEFTVSLENITDIKNRTAYFINPYGLKIVFNNGAFVIDDDYYKIYLENKDYKEIQKLYFTELLDKFSSLLEKAELNIDESNLLEFMKENILKSW